MKACIIDPSLFTLPYDERVIEGISSNGTDCTLSGRHLRTGEACELPSTKFGFRFYAHTDRFRNKRFGAWLKSINHISDSIRLSRQIRTSAFSVVHFQWAPIPVFDARLIKSIRRSRPVALTIHDTQPFLGAATSKLQAIGWRSLLSSPNRLIVHTQKSKMDLQALGISSDRISVIPHGIISLKADVLPEPKAAGEKRILLFGEIKPYKGVDILLKALAGLSIQSTQSWRLIVAGRPRMETAPLVELAKQSRIPVDFRFRYLTNSELKSLILSADICVFPYRNIDASGALMATMELGPSIVASSVGVFAETLVHGESALLFSAEDQYALAHCLKRLMENQSLRETLSQGAISLAKSAPTWSSIGKLTTSLYEELINDSNAAPPKT